MRTQLLDPVPVLGVFLLFAIITLGFYEVGFRIGRWWQDRLPGEQEGPTDMLVGSLLALMAILLAITMGMAADRFDTRRALVMDEAAAIQAVYLQAGYLPPAEGEQVRELLREYAPLRVATNDLATIQENADLSTSIHRDMWQVTEQVIQRGYNPDVMSAFGDSMSELITLHERRLTAGMGARVPQSVLMLLLAGSALSLGMVGYSAGLAGRRSVLSAVVMVVALGAVLVLVIDLDRPQDGFVTVSQQPLIDVQRQIGAPTP
jgi:hypothetical protein